MPREEPVRELPDALYWLKMVDRQGLSFDKCLEMPWGFVQDVEAARVGRRAYEQAKEQHERLQAASAKNLNVLLNGAE